MSALAAQLDSESVPDTVHRANDSKGCGAIMRSAPIGLGCGSAAVAFDMARDAGAVTHGHPSGYLSAAYFAAVIHDVAHGVALPAAMDTAGALLEKQDECRETMIAIARAREVADAGVPSPDAIESLGGGWVGEEALAIALACALTAGGSSPEQTASALWRAAAHGGDSDSTAAITGNLLGAMHGTACLPPVWLEDLELRDVIERIAEDLSACAAGADLDYAMYPPY
jgi:ADP-ribosyl-[dinitrogen reductase] hydrolase